MKRIEHRAISIMIFLFSVAFAVGALTMPMGTVRAPGPGLVPLILSLATAVTSGVVALFSYPKEPDTEDSFEKEFVKPLSIAIILAGIIAVFESAGYLASIFVGAFLVLKVLEKMSLIKSLIIAFVLCLSSYLLFARVLGVSLPSCEICTIFS